MTFKAASKGPVVLYLRAIVMRDTRTLLATVAGCAVAALIAGSGMESFYQQRTAYATRPAEDADGQSADYGIYDDPEFCDSFTEESGDGLRSARRWMARW